MTGEQIRTLRYYLRNHKQYIDYPIAYFLGQGYYYPVSILVYGNPDRSAFIYHIHLN